MMLMPLASSTPSAAARRLAFSSCSGPRLRPLRARRHAARFVPHNPWLVTIGLFLIYTGFWGFYAACNVPLISPATIAGQITGDDLDGDHYLSRRRPRFQRHHGELHHVAVGRHDGRLYHLERRSVLDLFMRPCAASFPLRPATISTIRSRPCSSAAYRPASAYKLHYWVERRFKIDDAVGAVAVHGYGGFLGVVFAGFMLWGHPSSPYEGFAHINPLGNFIGASSCSCSASSRP